MRALSTRPTGPVLTPVEGFPRTYLKTWGTGDHRDGDFGFTVMHYGAPHCGNELPEAVRLEVTRLLLDKFPGHARLWGLEA